MLSASDEGLQIMEKMVETGEAKDRPEAYSLLHQRYPALCKRYRQESPQRLLAAPVEKQEPLDFSERKVLRKQQLLADAELELLVEHAISTRGLTRDKAQAVVVEERPDLWELRRAQRLFGRQG